jgi:hypothetical protein
MFNAPPLHGITFAEPPVTNKIQMGVFPTSWLSHFPGMFSTTGAIIVLSFLTTISLCVLCCYIYSKHVDNKLADQQLPHQNAGELWLLNLPKKIGFFYLILSLVSLAAIATGIISTFMY